MTPHDAELVRKLYAPSSKSMAEGLLNIGRGLDAALVELSRNATPEKCEEMQRRLTAAGNAVGRLRATLISEGSQ